MVLTLDNGTQAYKDSVQELYNAMAGSDEQEQKLAFENFGESLAEKLASETDVKIETLASRNADTSIMNKRTGRMQLTSDEMSFFNEAVQKQTIEGLDELFPTTIIETIMSDLAKEHPLISAVDKQYTEAAVKIIYADPAEVTAYWDIIPADIRQILLGTFKSLDMTVSKLSGYIALTKGYFELGPAWLANYVLTYLREAMSTSLEAGIVNGDGKHKPIGMMRKLSGAVDGVYPAKAEVAITEMSPVSLAGPRALLAREKMLNGQLTLIVNPETSATKIEPNLFFQSTETGAWSQTNLPYGINVIESYAVPVDKAVMGNTKNYLLAVAGDLEIRKYEETLAIEDMDLFIAKFFATGIAKNPNAFVVLDLTGISGVTVPTPEGPADLETQDNINPVNPDDSFALNPDGTAVTDAPAG